MLAHCHRRHPSAPCLSLAAAPARSLPRPLLALALLALALVAALLLPLLAVAPARAQDAPAGLGPGAQAACASFDELERGATYAPNATITAGDSIILKTGPAITAESKAVIGPDIYGGGGNSLGIIAILIGLVSEGSSASQLEFAFQVDEGPVQVRVNGIIINLPSLHALDGRTVGSVRVAVGDVNSDGFPELRARGPIVSFAVGGKALWIDDLCILAADTAALRGLDLGDAPDSSNHWGAAMTAYAPVPARFPTVYQPAAGPVGPAHRAPLPFHLGQGVSREANADFGPDADPTNNIIPPADSKNRDRFDDGLNPALIPFAHCAKPVFPVRVFISPAALANLPNGGFINVWVDANRDGDWEDSGPCTTAEGANVVAGEHFVVDAPVNAAALGAGLHTITIAANRHVAWPANLAGQPAWLRVTLSEAPSVKLPALAYGDGRGPTPPFLMGETEDYLWRPASDPANGPDLEITKRGRVVVRPVLGDEQGEYTLGLRVAWVVEYRNVGSQALDAGFTLADDLINEALYANGLVIRTAPALAYTRDGSVITFQGGPLQPGEGGRILLTATLPDNALLAPIINRATATAQGDANAGNNTAEATARALIPAPHILAPGSGTTNRNQFTLRGLAWGASEIDLYMDGAKVATVPVTDGKWFHYFDDAADGPVSFVAVARAGSLSSLPSNVVAITVDSGLAWNPLSLRIIGPNGHAQRPTDEQGRTDAEGWRIWLRPGTPYTVSMSLCNNENVQEATFQFAGQPPVALGGPDTAGRYRAQFVSPAAINTPLAAEINVSCAAAGVAAASPAAPAARVGGGSAARMGMIRVVDALTLEPVETATVIGAPAYHPPALGWYGCLTCTVAAASPAAMHFAITFEDILISSLADAPAPETPSFVFHTITWLKATAPGYQPHTRSLSLNFDRIGGGLEIRLLPAIEGAPGAGQPQGCALVNNELIEGPLAFLKGQTVCILNLSDEDRLIDVEGSAPDLLPSAASAATPAALPAFNTGALAPGESVSFVAAAAGSLTLTDAADPTLSATIDVADTAPIYLPFVNR